MRYFLEVSYLGTAYSGFQTQHNANTIQAEVEKALKVFCKQDIKITGSSRTDAGVHAFQNYFHFDFEDELSSAIIYNLNSLLPVDITIKELKKVNKEAHCRFDAISREYKYFIYNTKNAFLRDRAFYYPYKLDLDSMKTAASILKEYSDFTSFSKKHTQVKSFQCKIIQSEWEIEKELIVYKIKANRFLRGMVRALVGTMLRLGRGKITVEDFRKIIEDHDCALASFGVPPQGLFLVSVEYPQGYFS